MKQVNTNIRFFHKYVCFGKKFIKTAYIDDENIGLSASLLFLKENGLNPNEYIHSDIIEAHPTLFNYKTLSMKFNPENKTQLTIAECLAPAMEIKEQIIADEYMKDYISYLDNEIAWTVEACTAIVNGDFRSAESLAKTNLAYYAGYYDDATRERVERLFDCGHPIFGKLSEMGTPTGEESFQCGMQRKTLKEIRNKK